MSKMLVAYFSSTGTTAGVAKALAQAINADLCEIKPEVPYTKEDLNWKDMQARSTIEMHNLAFRPTIADRNARIEAYDTIFVGFPIWWHTAPTIINTFLESYDFTEKTIVIFATAGGPGFGNTIQQLKTSYPDLMLKEGKVFIGNHTKDELAVWVDSLNL